ncbi:GNAT family N-acetyltransferase [Komarekiella sp. 'clone 1']|uniref:GNAT family N-acetyltransferase n=1 Tax=Komarekiella delphini-convector SJRDD-AB1 TaxID=2593771 RepID=A0AA40T1S6_9NOST|nr:GNAT family N-acetyltransferase [Komarekiella delphini-convector]MBD6619339.1 GNAT family N-acetyltransferase [Komarekiella delphini-convector SJRDD-AB1]
MTKIKLTTKNLELIASTLEIAQVEISDKSKFSELLNALVPSTWPPEFNDDETMSFFLHKLQEAPEQSGWWCWYFVLNDVVTDARTLIGNGGFKGKPTFDGTVEIGYSVLQEFQNLGYGTEAIEALVSWAFDHPEVRQVIAETLPELKASQRVLEKSQFTYVGQGSEEGIIRYELSRSHMKSGAAN